MLRLPLRTERQAFLKKGWPAHATTGAARSSSIQREAARGRRRASGSPGSMPPMERTKRGTVSAKAVRKRRVMSRSSPSSATLPAGGSSAMPQSGQSPGPVWLTSGCMGQV